MKLSEAGERLLEAADELQRFARGENTEPMVLYMPDGAGGLVRREVRDMAEYHQLWYQEGLRALSEAFPARSMKG